MLTVRDNRRSRSKSPSGRDRDRDRSRSRDERDRSPPREERKRKSIKIEIGESESESEGGDQRSRDKRGSRKHHDSESEDERRRSKKNSKKYDDSDSEDDRRKKSSSKRYVDSDSDNRKHSGREHRSSGRHGESDSDSNHRRQRSKKSSKKDYHSDSGSSEEESRHRRSHAPLVPYVPAPQQRYQEDDRRYSNYARGPQYGYAPAPGQYIQDPQAMYHETRHMSFVDPRQSHVPVHSDTPRDHRTHSLSGAPQYYQPSRYEYAEPERNIRYNREDPQRNTKHKTKTEESDRKEIKYNYNTKEEKKEEPALVYQTKKGGAEYVKKYNKDGKVELVEIKPETKDNKKSEKRSNEDEKRSNKNSSHTDVLSSRLSHLAVGGALGTGTLLVVGHDSHDGGKPPASPLLEAYRGTYQSISPMPSPLMIADRKYDLDLSDLDLSGSDSDSKKKKSKSKRHDDSDSDAKHKAASKHREFDVSMTLISPSITRKKVSFYDPTDDAKKIANALAGTSRAPNIKPLMSILPYLSTDDILALRAEYKNHAKIAGQGINMAKHIKMRISGNLGKAVYATALGRWESEAYWANSWYQGGASRRELLIESLMGRSNSDIREIKNCFRDKRYGDDLEKCMRAELKADKFRMAILLALEERRMSDTAPLDVDLIARDIQDLYKALTSREGGETAMLEIIVVRSDAHLREVMKGFERVYQRSFARDMIAKSRNLVVRIIFHSHGSHQRL